MSRDVLDLIDSTLGECEESDDAMRWAPDEPDPTPAGLPAPRLLVPVVADADLAALRQAADTAGLFMRTIAAQLRPAMEEISKAVAEFMRMVGRPDFERRSRLRRMHTEYHRRRR